MAIPFIAVFGKITASLINQLIAGVNGVAFSGVIPASVAGTGVTVSPGGKITFTNATSVTVIGVFTGSYDNYRVSWNVPTQTANSDLAMRVNTAGVDDTSANYNYNRGFFRGSDGTANDQMTTAASQWLLTVGANSTQTNDGYMDLYGPALARYTAGQGQATVYYSSLPQMYTTITGLRHNATASWDGFSIYPASGGTISGTIRVYGYNNLT
jgi:hypothetical protein